MDEGEAVLTDGGAGGGVFVGDAVGFGEGVFGPGGGGGRGRRWSSWRLSAQARLTAVGRQLSSSDLAMREVVGSGEEVASRAARAMP